jgi:predicted RNase H-like HicB family nuclease
LPELITEGDSVEEAFNNTIDAFITTLKLYENLGRDLPDSIRLNRKARQVPADMRECFETINPKSLK